MEQCISCKYCGNDIERDPCRGCTFGSGFGSNREPVGEKSQWIPVTEQLPEPYELVLISIISRNGYGEPATYETMAWIEKGEWVVPGDNLYKGEKIAYWMPMPDPPEIENTVKNNG